MLTAVILQFWRPIAISASRPAEADMLRGLSKSLGRAGVVGREARSLAPFTASFTCAQDLFDFVDAGGKKDGADFKITETFQLFIDNH
ncbi:hypothetical protein VTN77DRAFT_4058 [Rasamsonia byssochlamydoides]|uniref:uncharacterized protein n=1 Tax=Rasamsonia byssochlamydoides TaxID=89139 RepID=UPI003742ED8B